MNGTPIYDIKPYLPFVDSIPNAQGGFADEVKDYALTVEFPEHLLEKIPQHMQKGLLGVLAQDPRPQYQKDETRTYGFGYGQWEVKFKVKEAVLTVCAVEPLLGQ